MSDHFSLRRMNFYRMDKNFPDVMSTFYSEKKKASDTDE